MSETEESNTVATGWIPWFCNLEDHNFFCEIEHEFIKDNFNLYGLRKQFLHFEFPH